MARFYEWDCPSIIGPPAQRYIFFVMLAFCHWLKSYVRNMRCGVRQLRMAENRWESWLTVIIWHVITRVTVLVAMMNSRMVGTIHVPGWSDTKFHLCRYFSFPFGPAILKPDFDLCFGQLERFWKLCPTRNGQIFASAKFAFKFFNLCCGESRSFTLLWRISASSSLSWAAFLLYNWKRRMIFNLAFAGTFHLTCRFEIFSLTFYKKLPSDISFLFF